MTLPCGGVIGSSSLSCKSGEAVYAKICGPGAPATCPSGATGTVSWICQPCADGTKVVFSYYDSATGTSTPWP